MKYEELQYERLGDANKTYPASTLVIRKQFVDAAIAELKSENERLNLQQGILFKKKEGDEMTLCDELKATEIYARFAEEVYDDFGDSPQEQEYYRKEHADAAIAELKRENRRLKRALWLARGYIMTLLNRDFQRLAYQCNNGDYKKNLLRRRNRYYELSEKCLKKAEEYYK